MMSLLSIFFFQLCWANDHWDSFLQAQSIEALVQAETQMGLKQNWQKRCELEKANDWFPENCLYLLEYRLQSPQSMSSLRVINEELSQSCVRNAKKVGSFTKIQSLVTTFSVSKVCLQALTEQALDLRYRDGTHLVMPKEYEESFSTKNLL